MKKGPNKSSDPPARNFTLPKSKILRGRKNFQRLFESDAVTVREKYIRLRFHLLADAENNCLMGFIVRKKLGNAVERNKVKRLLKEAYRLNQHLLNEPIDSSRFSLHGALMANTTDLNFKQVEEPVVALLNKAKNHILSITHP